MSVLPHLSRLYQDYLALADTPTPTLRPWYPAAPGTSEWIGHPVAIPHPGPLADALSRQAVVHGAGPEQLANIEKLRHGARAVVTGQQVGLFGGPLLTLLKAATAIARAAEATAATGIPHVPLFWLASEDHDLAEVDQVTLPAKHSLEVLSLGESAAEIQPTAGSVPIAPGIEALLDQASELMAYAPISDLLRECYGQPGATFGSAFARLMTSLFAAHGLIVMDPAGRDFHALGRPALHAALADAEALESALLTRTRELESAGYHAQVLVKPGSSLLFLISDVPSHPGLHDRQALRRTANGTWKAGSKVYTTEDLLAILEAEPERLSPNALLRPVFQDTLLPTAAYIGGPAEIAYFAQSAVVSQHLLGRVTPVLPRLSATLVSPAMATVLARHELTLGDLFEAKTPDALAHRLGARAMPIEGKRRLAAVGQSMDAELTALLGYMHSIDASLGRSAQVSANKMRYQMNRLRRMAATFEVQKEASLTRHAQALMLHLFPQGHPQERILAGAWFLSQREDLIDLLVREAAQMCLGHSIIPLTQE